MKKRIMAGVFSTFLLLQNSVPTTLADAFGGARSGEFTIGAKESNNFNIRFYGGKPAYVDLVVTNKETKLELSVFDMKGNLIAKDKESDRAWLDYKYTINWIPKDSAVYKIKVVNNSSSTTYYFIEAN